MNKIKFDVDWGDLLPGKMFQVQGMSHKVKPLGIRGISSIIKKMEIVLPQLKEKGLDLNIIDNIESYSVSDIVKTVTKSIPILMDCAPDVISDATGIEKESLMDFPPEYLIELVTLAIEVNLESKESLEKNFNRLMGAFRKKEKSKGTE